MCSEDPQARPELLSEGTSPGLDKPTCHLTGTQQSLKEYVLQNSMEQGSVLSHREGWDVEELSGEEDEGARASTETGTRTVLQAALGPAQNLDIILSSNKGGTQGVNCYRHEGRNESLSVKFTSIECRDPEGHDFTAWLGQPEPE